MFHCIQCYSVNVNVIWSFNVEVPRKQLKSLTKNNPIKKFHFAFILWTENSRGEIPTVWDFPPHNLILFKERPNRGQPVDSLLVWSFVYLSTKTVELVDRFYTATVCLSIHHHNHHHHHHCGSHYLSVLRWPSHFLLVKSFSLQNLCC